MTYTFTAYIERDNGPFDQHELECVVTYNVSKSYAATYMQPAEGGEVEITSVTHKGVEIDLTQAEEAFLQAEAEERASRQLAEEAAEYADWQYQQYRDRKMMGDDA